MKLDQDLLKKCWSQHPLKFIGIGVTVAALTLALFSDASSSEPTQPQRNNKKQKFSIDTMIPEGKVLIPIEVQNFESLDSILGNHGVVDLYPVQTLNGQIKQPVARAIKIIRASKNSSDFAVLAPESEAPYIVRQPGPFHVVIQNKSRSGTDFVKPRTRPRRIIIETKE